MFEMILMKNKDLFFRKLLLTFLLISFAAMMTCMNDQEKRTQEKPGENVSSAQRPDLFIILLDSLRADEIDRRIDGQLVMPHLHHWAEQHMRFAMAQSSSSSTPTSVSALFTSLPVQAFHGNFYRGIPRGVPVLAEILSREGYLSLGYSANPNCSSNLGHARGFHRFVQAFSDPDLATGRRIRKDHPARIVNPDVLLKRVLEDLDPAPSKPLFVYIHLLQPHAPYAPPSPHREIFHRQGQVKVTLDLRKLIHLDRKGQFDDDWLASLRSHYDGHSHWVDQAVGNFLKALEIHPRFSTAGIIILSDHGEGFGEHGRILHNTTVYEEMIRIPLLMKLPESSPMSAKSGEIIFPVDLIDVAPTLCCLAGIKRPALFQGIDLIAAADDPEAWMKRPLLSMAVSQPQISLRIGSYKMIRFKNKDKIRMALFDCRNDPDETQDIARQDPEIYRFFTNQLKKELTRYTHLEIKPAYPRSLDGEKLEILRSLGYIDTESSP